MAQKTKKGKFRVATAGKAIDGRDIKPEWLTSIAKNYSPETRLAQINLEHLYGITGSEPFSMKGDVVSVEAKEEELKFGDKTEKRTTLWAEIEANEHLINLVAAKQKQFTSIEVWDKFNGDENEFYLGGIACTDNPASFHTSRLNFSARFGSIISEALETKFEPLDGDQTDDAATSIFDALMSKLQNAFAAPKPDAKPEASETAASSPAEFAMLQETFSSGLKEVATIFTSLKAEVVALKTTQESAAADFTKFKTEVENSPAGTFTPRSTSTGDTEKPSGFRF